VGLTGRWAAERQCCLYARGQCPGTHRRPHHPEDEAAGHLLVGALPLPRQQALPEQAASSHRQRDHRGMELVQVGRRNTPADLRQD